MLNKLKITLRSLIEAKPYCLCQIKNQTRKVRKSDGYSQQVFELPSWIL